MLWSGTKLNIQVETQLDFRKRAKSRLFFNLLNGGFKVHLSNSGVVLSIGPLPACASICTNPHGFESLLFKKKKKKAVQLWLRPQEALKSSPCSLPGHHLPHPSQHLAGPTADSIQTLPAASGRPFHSSSFYFSTPRWQRWASTLGDFSEIPPGVSSENILWVYKSKTS